MQFLVTNYPFVIGKLSLKVSKSHNHRMGKVERGHSGLSGPASLLKPGHPREHCTALCPDGS